MFRENWSVDASSWHLQLHFLVRLLTKDQEFLTNHACEERRDRSYIAQSIKCSTLDASDVVDFFQ